MQAQHWYGNSSMYESNLIIKSGKNLSNFVCRAVAAFVSARPGAQAGVMMIKVGILDRKVP